MPIAEIDQLKYKKILKLIKNEMFSKIDQVDNTDKYGLIFYQAKYIIIVM